MFQRNQCICFDNIIYSKLKSLTSGLSQGSILDSKLFALYINSIKNYLKNLGLCYHVHAEDIQIYFNVKRTI